MYICTSMANQAPLINANLALSREQCIFESTNELTDKISKRCLATIMYINTTLVCYIEIFIVWYISMIFTPNCYKINIFEERKKISQYCCISIHTFIEIWEH